MSDQINTSYPWPVPRGWECVWNTPYACSLLNEIFTTLFNLSNSGMVIYPHVSEIFRAFDLCPLDNISLIIIGQDPYHDYDKKIGRCMANGLAFSGNKGGKTPRSLSNVFKELKRTYPNVVLNHYDLTTWAQQGILLVNTSFTVEAGKPGTHVKLRIWDKFFDYILRAINYFRPNILYCIWGNDAKKYTEGIDPPIKSPNKLFSGHPSPANRNPSTQFIGNNVFIDIYNYIEYINRLSETSGSGKTVNHIDWNLY